MNIDALTIFDLPEYPLVGEAPEISAAEAFVKDWLALRGDWPI